jgi:CRP/FNR family transcriptional regulator
MSSTDTAPACICRIDDCVLCEARLFSALASNQVCDIKGMVGKQAYRKRDVIFREGDPCDRLYIIKDGMVKLSKSLPDGREQIMCPRGAGQLIGFSGLGSTNYPVTATALTDVDTCSIDHSDMERVLQNNPGTAMDVIGLLNQELGQSQAMICNLGLKNATEKVASFILSLVPGDAGETAHIPLPLSRQEIGEMLGLTVETVSRIMAEFRREQILESPRGGIELLSISRLKTLSGDQMTEAEYLGAVG